MIIFMWVECYCSYISSCHVWRSASEKSSCNQETIFANLEKNIYTIKAKGEINWHFSSFHGDFSFLRQIIVSWLPLIQSTTSMWKEIYFLLLLYGLFHCRHEQKTKTPTLVLEDGSAGSHGNRELCVLPPKYFLNLMGDVNMHQVTAAKDTFCQYQNGEMSTDSATAPWAAQVY